MNVERVPIVSLRPHPRNPRHGDVAAICESLKAHGQFRPIVAQRSTGYILAGNHTWKAARTLKWAEIDVVWQDCTDDDAYRILLVDNRTADLAAYDNPELAALLQELAESERGLAGTGYTGDALEELLRDLAYEGSGGLADNYSRKIEAPIYTPKGKRPTEAELYDRTRTDSLLAEIAATPELPAEVAAFLRNAAERHTVFRFDRIAEYYAHAPAEVQNLMERSALIIIDFGKAVELGYIKLTEAMLAQAGYEASDA